MSNASYEPVPVCSEERFFTIFFYQGVVFPFTVCRVRIIRFAILQAKYNPVMAHFHLTDKRGNSISFHTAE